MLAPPIYHNVLGAIEDQVDMIKREQVTVRFSPTAAKVDPSTGHVLVTGDLTTTGVQGTSQSEVRTYDMNLIVFNYRILLAGIDVYKGGPHNQLAH
jgi:conjugal transfer pilus assembly protein TraE